MERSAAETNSDQPSLLCIDIGTTSVKAALVDVNGRAEVLSREQVLFHEEDLYRWHATTWERAVEGLVSRMPWRSPVAGIVVSGNGPTLVPLDARGNEVGRVLMWMDGRDEQLAEDRSFFLPKVAWLRAHRPADFERVRTFISCPEYIAFVLTGETVTVSPSDEFAPYIWTANSIDAYRLDSDLFPRFIRPGEAIGETGVGSRNTFGLPPGIPVYVGGPDFLMSLLGTATVRDGRVCDRAGTSEGINACSAGAVDDVRVRCLPHVVPGLYNNAGILSSTGRMFEWFRDISGQTQESYDLMLRNISRLDRTRDVPWFFPSLHQGASWEFSRGMFIGLGAIHGRVEMGRAVVESIGFSVREAVEILEENDLSVGEIRACGGQAKNHTWNQMKADIIGKPLLVPQVEDAELVGNAAVGFFGLGLYDSLADAAESLVHFKAEYSPQADEHLEVHRAIPSLSGGVRPSAECAAGGGVSPQLSR